MKLTKTFVIVACAGLLSAGVIGSARRAFAQDAAATPGDEGGHAEGSVATQPDKKSPPSDFNGCWDGSSHDGSLDDRNYGTGYGWIGIIQDGTKIVGGMNESYYEFRWDDGAYAYGFVSGKVKGTGFTGTLTAGGKCKAKLIGHLGTNSDIVGTYDFHNCKTKTSNFIAVGTFDLPLNNSGCADIKP
ncbi:MAG TPA: hypothetical protein VIW95_17085 [Candidatus Binatus sp.]|uniref:hypothetical protein n=1 Tax=Candidatus Binatus sp. TaxID=2811406 RepID=UPI002F41E5E2